MEIAMTLATVEDCNRLMAQLYLVTKNVENGEKFDATIKKFKVKRSRNANDYSWVLQREIARVLNRKIDDIHEEMVLQYGVMETYSIKKDAWESAKRVFDYFKILGESEMNGATFVHARVGVGTRYYTVQEMKTFLDGVVAEAKDLDIPTETPKQLAEMYASWGERGCA